MKKKYSIIGNPLSHSLSPTLHNYWFKKYNLNAEYDLMQIKEENIPEVIRKIKNKEIDGINVTLPFKQKVIPYLSKIINDAKESNSVNTIYLDNDNDLIGDNTDVYGLQAAYLKELISTEKKNLKALIIGAGGVSPSVILSLKKSNVNNISIVNRTFEKSLFLKKIFKNINVLKWNEFPKSTRDYDIIINATSLGLKGGDDFDFSFQELKPETVYIDTIYNPLQTEMIKNLKAQNIKTFNGLDMFIYQGQKSFYIWNKINPEVDDELINLLESKIKS